MRLQISQYFVGKVASDARRLYSSGLTNRTGHRENAYFMDVMKTLFLNPPSYDDFDGGAGSRYQATREVWSFWYPTWLAYPAGMIPGARLLDAPPHNYSVEQTINESKNYDLVVLHTSTPSLRMDLRTAESIKAANPNAIIAFVGGHPTARPEEVLKLSNAVDIAGRKEFD